MGRRSRRVSGTGRTAGPRRTGASNRYSVSGEILEAVGETVAQPLRVTLRYFDGCPSWRVARERLEAILREDAPFDVEPRLERVETTEDAERLRFVSSPTILINGADPFAVGGERVGLACRVYRTPDGFAGSPTTEQLRAALHAASASTSGARFDLPSSAKDAISGA